MERHRKRMLPSAVNYRQSIAVAVAMCILRDTT